MVNTFSVILIAATLSLCMYFAGQSLAWIIGASWRGVKAWAKAKRKAARVTR